MIKYILTILLFAVMGCGAIEDYAEEIIEDNIPAPVTINYQQGSGAPVACPDCPRGSGITAIYPFDRDDGTWALGIAFSETCDKLSRVAGMVFIRTKSDTGEWVRYGTNWPMTIMGCDDALKMAVSGPFPHPNPAPWGGLDPDDIFIELVTASPNFVYEQAFSHPVNAP